MDGEGSSSSSGGGGAGVSMNSKRTSSGQEAEVRKGPWTMEEDLILVNYIANHGEGVWNSLARSAGLNRTGKSCRLRWLNYLRPDVRRGNITPQEQLLIMELHARWGNRWSKIARQLPGRTDNEIKNYWRTRIQKRVKQISDQSSMELQNAAAMLADEPSQSNSRSGSVAVAPPSQYQPDYDQPYFNDAAAAAAAAADGRGGGGGGGGFQQSQLSPDSGEHFWTFEDFWTMQSPDDDYMK